jgi:hypothetical protein
MVDAVQMAKLFWKETLATFIKIYIKYLIFNSVSPFMGVCSRKIILLHIPQ